MSVSCSIFIAFRDTDLEGEVRAAETALPTDVSEPWARARRQTYIICSRETLSCSLVKQGRVSEELRMHFQRPILLTLIILASPGATFAQPLVPGGLPRAPGAVIERQPNTTGNDRDKIIARGATGADTITTDSAAGGNAVHPERAVPNGSAGGGSGGGGR